MAQTTLNRYYAVRKRPAAGDINTTVKRRKLTEDACLHESSLGTPTAPTDPANPTSPVSATHSRSTAGPKSITNPVSPKDTTVPSSTTEPTRTTIPVSPKNTTGSKSITRSNSSTKPSDSTSATNLVSPEDTTGSTNLVSPKNITRPRSSTKPRSTARPKGTTRTRGTTGHTRPVRYTKPTSPKKPQSHLPAYKRFSHLLDPAGPPPSSSSSSSSSELAHVKTTPVIPSSTHVKTTTPSLPTHVKTAPSLTRVKTTPTARSSTHLATSTASLSGDLPLPRTYQLLAEKFHCTDTVVNMLQKRQETCTFDKVKQAVQEMTRRNFQESNLAQMKTVHPNAFVFRQEKNIPGIYDRRRYEQYQLTIECVPEDGAVGSRGCLGPTALVQRRKVFHHNLTKIVRKHHQAFLSTLNPPLSIPDEKVVRWHPAFPLEKIPGVEPAPLPKPPITEAYTTARDVLNVAQSNMAPRVKQALAGVAAKSEEKGEGGGASESTARSEPELDPALRGIPKALLEKIRQKEAARAAAAITRDPLREKQLEMIARLPEFCRIVRIFFVAEKKAAIPWDNVVQKLSESHTSGLSTVSVEEHLHYLLELAPSCGQWMKCVTCGPKKCRYIKISKNADIKLITKKLEEIGKELRK